MENNNPNNNPFDFSQITHACVNCKRFLAPVASPLCVNCALQLRRDARLQDPNPRRRF